MCSYLIEISNSTQAVKLKFERNEFGTTAAWREYIFTYKKSLEQVDEIKDKLYLSQSFPIVSFNFILSCP